MNECELFATVLAVGRMEHGEKTPGRKDMIHTSMMTKASMSVMNVAPCYMCKLLIFDINKS